MKIRHKLKVYSLLTVAALAILLVGQNMVVPSAQNLRLNSILSLQLGSGATPAGAKAMAWLMSPSAPGYPGYVALTLTQPPSLRIQQMAIAVIRDSPTATATVGLNHCNVYELPMLTFARVTYPQGKVTSYSCSNGTVPANAFLGYGVPVDKVVQHLEHSNQVTVPMFNCLDGNVYFATTNLKDCVTSPTRGAPPVVSELVAFVGFANDAVSDLNSLNELTVNEKKLREYRSALFFKLYRYYMDQKQFLAGLVSDGTVSDNRKATFTAAANLAFPWIKAQLDYLRPFALDTLIPSDQFIPASIAGKCVIDVYACHSDIANPENLMVKFSSQTLTLAQQLQRVQTNRESCVSLAESFSNDYNCKYPLATTFNPGMSDESLMVVLPKKPNLAAILPIIFNLLTE